MFEKILGLLDERVKEWLKEAYDVGYEVGSEDANRRMHDMYTRGFISGYANAKAEIGEIDLEPITDDITEALEGEPA